MASEYYNPPIPIKPKDMKLRDIVCIQGMEGGLFSWSIVERIANGLVHFYRPYGGSHETGYSGPSVICYMSVEKYSVPLDSDMHYLLAERSPTR